MTWINLTLNVLLILAVASYVLGRMKEVVHNVNHEQLVVLLALSFSPDAVDKLYKHYRSSELSLVEILDRSAQQRRSLLLCSGHPQTPPFDSASSCCALAVASGRGETLWQAVPHTTL